jgi:hypothetical protein
MKKLNICITTNKCNIHSNGPQNRQSKEVKGEKGVHSWERGVQRWGEREGGGKKARLRQWTRGGITVDIQHTTGCP